MTSIARLRCCSLIVFIGFKFIHEGGRFQFRGRDALLLVLADRQVSPTVLSSSLFCHAAILRGKFGGVNFRLCSRRRFTLTRQVASTRQAAFTSFRRGQRATTVSLPRINHFAAQALEWRGVARDDSMAA